LKFHRFKLACVFSRNTQQHINFFLDLNCPSTDLAHETSQIILLADHIEILTFEDDITHEWP